MCLLRTLTKTIHILFLDGLSSLCLCENLLEGCDSSVFMDGVWNGIADCSKLFLLFLKRKKCWGSRQKLVEPLLNLRTAACQPTGLSNASRDVSHTLVLLRVFVCMSLSLGVLAPVLSHLLMPWWLLISFEDWWKNYGIISHDKIAGNGIILDIPYTILRCMNHIRNCCQFTS